MHFFIVLHCCLALLVVHYVGLTTWVWSMCSMCAIVPSPVSEYAPYVGLRIGVCDVGTFWGHKNQLSYTNLVGDV